MYEYKAKYVYNYDGDTVDLVVDLGFNITFEIKVRLSGINAYELKETDTYKKEMAYKAKDYVKEKLSSASAIIIKTEKDKTEKYGRYLATIFYDNINLNEELIKIGLVNKYL